MKGASQATGLSSPTEPCSTVSALTGFDPSRKGDIFQIEMDATRRRNALSEGVQAARALKWLQDYGLNPWHGSSYGQDFTGYEEAKPYLDAARESLANQLSETAIALALADVEESYALATETRRAETTGSVEDEGAGPKDNAHTPSQPSNGDEE